MDFEWQIRMLEKELAHYKEMQALVPSHQDAHDVSLAATEATLKHATDQHAAEMNDIRATIKELSALTVLTAQQLAELKTTVAAILESDAAR